MVTEPRTRCRTPTPNKSATNIPTWKFEALKNAILKIVGEAGPKGLLFSKLPERARAELSAEVLEKLRSIGWHATTVKLELEVRGALKRLRKATPQCLALGAWCLG